MKEIIKFTKSEIKECEEFAEKIKWRHPHFKDKRNTTKRTEEQVKDDVILGKLAEVAVKKYLDSKYGNRVSNLDFNIYGSGIADDCDIKVDDYIISIKSSKIWSSCLLIGSQKFETDSDNNLIKLENKTPPDFFIFARINLSKDNIYAEISGAVLCEEFWNNKRFLPRGFLLNKINSIKYIKLIVLNIY